MKILVVHNGYQSHFIGGEDIVVARELAALQSHLGHENVFEYGISNDEITLKKLAKNIWGDCQHYQAIKEIVRTKQIDVVHVHNFFPLLTPSVFAAAKAAGAKVVHTLHNFRWWCLAGTFYREDKGNCEQCVGKAFALSGIMHRCYRNSFIQSAASAAAFAWYRFKAYQQYIDAYFALSHFQAAKIRPWLHNQQVFYKPNPIEPADTLCPLTEKKDYLFVGRLEAAKGIELLLKAWEGLPSHFRLTVIGKGEDESRLIVRYKSPQISFLGQLPHAQTLAYIAKAKYLLHTSLAYETFGLTMVEALARQTPVIGLNQGTRKEMIEHGKNGFLCEKEKLVQTILQSFMHADYEQMAKQAQISVQAFYTDTVILKQISLYHTIINAHAHA